MLSNCVRTRNFERGGSEESTGSVPRSYSASAELASLRVSSIESSPLKQSRHLFPSAPNWTHNEMSVENNVAGGMSNVSLESTPPTCFF